MNTTSTQNQMTRRTFLKRMAASSSILGIASMSSGLFGSPTFVSAAERPPSRFMLVGEYERRYGTPSGLEAVYISPADDMVIVGMGFRAKGGNVTTMHLKFAALTPHGTIDYENFFVAKVGSAPHAGLEVWMYS